MKKNIFYFIIISMFFFSKNINANDKRTLYEFSFNDVDGKTYLLSQHKNKVVLLVNVASQCGFTKQYADLQTLWDKYKNKNFVVIGVPSNDFGNQEPGTNAEIKSFCETNFNINFPIMEKVTVKGKNAHPVYLWAKESYGNATEPKWNFHKILIDKKGKINDTFISTTNPQSEKVVKKIEELINN
ncbi:BtuE Glutathione peroxidase [Candidatus Pelagibacterales bacterium]